MKKIYFTPGPSQLYYTAEEHYKTAFKEQIGSITHRGDQFVNIYTSVDQGIRQLLNLPDNYSVLFTNSATDIWESIIHNCVINDSLHIVNGAFSNKFHLTAQLLGVNARKIEASDGSCITSNDINADTSPELISFTHNETSTGAAQPLEDIYAIREKYPNALISVDVVSSLPFVNLDYSKVDAVYFSVQKCFGLPAGLGVWLVNDRCLEAAIKKESLRKITGANFRLTTMFKMAQKFQTVATPNVLSIFLLSKIIQDMNLKGIDMIRRETEYKSAVLYHTINNHSRLSTFVENEKFQSKTVIVSKVDNSKTLIEQLAKKGMMIGSGYGQYANQHIRIANFPTHSKEQIEMLSDYLASIE